jgi:hypothetical protein
MGNNKKSILVILMMSSGVVRGRCPTCPTYPTYCGAEIGMPKRVNEVDFKVVRYKGKSAVWLSKIYERSALRIGLLLGGKAPHLIA